MTYLLFKNGDRRYWNGNAYYSSRLGEVYFMTGAYVFKRFRKKDIYYLSIDGYTVIDNGEELGDMEEEKND